MTSPIRVDQPPRWRYAVPVLLAVVILIVFIPALDAGFVGWDDDDLILNTTRYRTLDAQSLEWMFTTSYTGHFQPLTWLSFTMDWALWHRETFGYHLTNVLLHILTALTFYFLTRRLLVAATNNTLSLRSAPALWSAAFAAALFALHPLRAESVAWVAERRDVLSGFLYVLSVLFYVRFVDAQDHGAPTGARRANYVMSVTHCALSLLAKASAMTLPLVLLVLDVYPLRRRRDRTVRRRRLLLEKLPFLILATLAAMRALIAQEQGGALQTWGTHGLWARLAQVCHGLTFYVGKTFCPTDLGPLYEIPGRAVLFGPMLWISVTAVSLSVVLAIAWRRRFPSLWATMAIYIVVLLPVLGLAQSGPQFVADRYSYLSCMGFAVLVAGGALGWLGGADQRRGLRRRLVVLTGAAGIVGMLAHATRLQADIWVSGRSLWARGVKVSPDSAIAHTNYGDALVVDRRLSDAVGAYRTALSLNSEDAVAHHHLGDVYRQMGRVDAAIYCYHHALKIDPNRFRACLSLAQLLIDRGHGRDAVTILRDGAQRHPDALELIDFLAQQLASHPDERVRNGEEAIAWSLHVNRTQGFGASRTLMTLASAYASAGRYDDAVLTAEQALSIAERESGPALAEVIQYRLSLFREGKPYRFRADR